MSKLHLAIDIGAGSGRHILGRLENSRLETEEIYRFPNIPEQREGHLCWNIESLWQNVLKGIRMCGERGTVPETIGIDTWGVDFILLDSEDRRLGQAVAYRDTRTAGMDKELEKKMPFAEHYRLTGTAKQPFNTVYQMMAVLKEHPEYREKAADFLFMPEYLSFLLTGRKAHEWTFASTSALADAKKRDWSIPVIRAAGLPEKWFSHSPVLPGRVLGHFSEEIAKAAGFDAKVVLPAMHDTGSAYMAIPAESRNTACLSSGTWSLLGTETDEPFTGDAPRTSGFTNEGGWNGSVRFLKNIMGLWMLQRLRAEDGERFSFAEMAELAEASDYPCWIDAADKRFLAPESMTREILSALSEAGAPKPENPGDLCRSVTMGLAVCYRDSIRELSQLTGIPFDSVNIVGGGSMNRVLNQWTASLTGLSVMAGPAEGTALGNLLGQMICTGELKDLREARELLRRSVEPEVFTPDAGGRL